MDASAIDGTWVRNDSAGLPTEAARGAGESPDETRLAGAAQEFEAMLIHSLLRSMNETSDEDSSLGSKTFRDWGLQAVSNAMAASGGFGLATRILEQLHGPSSPETRRTEASGTDTQTLEGKES